MSFELPAQGQSLLLATGWRARRPALLFEALGAGALVHHSADGTTRWPVTLHDLGSVNLDTGELVVADPYVSEPDTAPFTERLDPGEHRLLVGIAEIDEGHHRVACAVLVGRATPISAWRLAVQAGSTPDGLESDDSYYGFPVDAGTACIASPRAFAAATAVIVADGGRLEDPLAIARFSSPHDAAIAAPADGAEPVAVLTTGWGDGFYPTWLGMDDAGGVSLAVVDFLLSADEPPAGADEATPPAASRGRTGGRSWRRLWRRRPGSGSEGAVSRW